MKKKSRRKWIVRKGLRHVRYPTRAVVVLLLQEVVRRELSSRLRLVLVVVLEVEEANDRTC